MIITDNSLKILSNDSARTWILMQNVGNNDIFYTFHIEININESFILYPGDINILKLPIVVNTLMATCKDKKSSRLIINHD